MAFLCRWKRRARVCEQQKPAQLRQYGYRLFMAGRRLPQNSAPANKGWILQDGQSYNPVACRVAVTASSILFFSRVGRCTDESTVAVLWLFGSSTSCRCDLSYPVIGRRLGGATGDRSLAKRDVHYDEPIAIRNERGVSVRTRSKLSWFCVGSAGTKLDSAPSW